MKPSINGHCTAQTGSFACLFGCSLLARPLRLGSQRVGSPCSVVSLVSQVSEPCHDKPVNGVAQRAGGWRTGTPLFRSARNRNWLSVANVGGEGWAWDCFDFKVHSTLSAFRDLQNWTGIVVGITTMPVQFWRSLLYNMYRLFWGLCCCCCF